MEKGKEEGLSKGIRLGKLTADYTTKTITIGGTDASDFFSGTTFTPTPEQN